MHGRKTDRILHNVFNESDVSDFEGDFGNDASNNICLNLACTLVEH